MNKKISTGGGIAAVVVAVVIIAGAAWIAMTPKTQAPTGAVVPAKVNSMQGQMESQEPSKQASGKITYQNDRLINKFSGYSFQVPMNWKVDTSEGPGFVIVNNPETQKAFDEQMKKREVGEIPPTVMIKYYKNFADFKEENPLYDPENTNKDFAAATKNFGDYVNIAQKNKTSAQNITEISFGDEKGWIADYEDMMFGGNNAGIVAENNSHFYRVTFWGSKNKLSAGQKQIISSFKFE